MVRADVTTNKIKSYVSVTRASIHIGRELVMVWHGVRVISPLSTSNDMLFIHPRCFVGNSSGTRERSDP